MHAAVVARRTARVLLADFWYFWSLKSARKEKVTLWYFSFRVLFACPKRTKRTKRGKYSSFKHLLSPRGDRCEQSAPTVRQLLNHGYRFETLKRRLGFTAVPCQAMANLAVQLLVRKLVKPVRWRDRARCFSLSQSCFSSSNGGIAPIKLEISRMLKSAEKLSTACGKACWKPWFTTVFGFYFSKAAKKHFFLIFIKTADKQSIFHFFR